MRRARIVRAGRKADETMLKSGLVEELVKWGWRKMEMRPIWYLFLY